MLSEAPYKLFDAPQVSCMSCLPFCLVHSHFFYNRTILRYAQNRYTEMEAKCSTYFVSLWRTGEQPVTSRFGARAGPSLPFYALLLSATISSYDITTGTWHLSIISPPLLKLICLTSRKWNIVFLLKNQVAWNIFPYFRSQFLPL